jgi:hypothetical protein
MATTRSRTKKTAAGRGRATGTRRGGTKSSARRGIGMATSTRRTTKRATARRRPKEQNTSQGLVTTDHNLIRQWVEERGGTPACVRGTGDPDDVGVLRIDFPGDTGAESLQPISWPDFFDKFEERKLAFLHRPQSKDGGRSYFNKLIKRPRPRRRGTHGR